MIRSAIGIICLLLLIPASIALAADALVSVGEVTDKRTTGQFFAECEVVLKITGDAVADSLGIREVKITKAIDDTGRDLIKESNQISTFFNANEENKNTLDKKIILKNPSRKAQVITSLEGEIELFNPSKENGSLVVGEGFISNPGEPIAATDLDGQNVQIIYLTKESYEAKKKEFEEAKKKEMAESAGMLGEAFAELFSGMFGNFFSDEESSLKFFVRDPENKIIDMAFQSPDGISVKTWGRSRMGDFHTYSFQDSLPPADTQLIVYLATPESIKKIPFQLNNIPLP